MNLTFTLILIIINVGFSLYGFNNPTIIERFKYSPYRVQHHNEWYRIFTHAFLHGDMTHLFFNMFVLYQFGGVVEKIFISYYGNLGQSDMKGLLMYGVLYFGALIVATFPGMIKHKDNDLYASIGASGAVSAVVFFFAIMVPDAQLSFFFLIPMPAYLAALLILAFEFYMNKRSQGRIAHDAHIYGALVGVLFPLLMDVKIYINFYETVLGKIF